MRLTRVDFDYRIGDAMFTDLRYSFLGAPVDSNRDELIVFAKDSVTRLEGILDRVYPDFEKRVDGEVSAHRVAQGYDYRSPELSFDSSRLRYSIDLDPEGKPYDATITLSVSDRNHDRLLAVHDSVIMVTPEVSRQARIQLDRMRSLRSEPFVAERYLALESR